MREQRDAGIRGHVLLCETINRRELESLAGKKAFFFPQTLNRKSLGFLLEYQQTVALNPGQLASSPNSWMSMSFTRSCCLTRRNRTSVRLS